MSEYPHSAFVFQSTLPRGSDLLTVLSGTSILYFNPRSQGGATGSGRGPTRKDLFQSTLPRGSDVLRSGEKDKVIISIHAPKGERLFTRATNFFSDIISIHAPKGERLIRLSVLYLYCLISIHAPKGERPGRPPIERPPE